ncbi:hypothetical protein PGIGA_G00168660 [Pangasianodon gigas]|uniref:Uncharacterized protein n=1 Tax=Pangasianodon gigas TaxID=30993 RepID=A0ACC5XTA2_PANGG|nr:hypothetical protein [Pangasianodon gigas]
MSGSLYIILYIMLLKAVSCTTVLPPTTEKSPSADPSTIEPTTNSTTGETQSGLTAGEAAGVAVGTIAGVGLLGGGIYAGLKYSGKLG